MADLLGPHAIFLGCKGKGNKSAGLQDGFRGGKNVDGVRLGPKLDVGEAEWVGVSGGLGVFTRAEQEEEGQPHEIGGGKRGGVARCGRNIERAV